MEKQLFLKFVGELHEIESQNNKWKFPYFNFCDYNDRFWGPIKLLFLEHYNLDGWNQLNDYVYWCGQDKSWGKDENGVDLWKDDEYFYEDLELNFKNEH